MLNVDLVIAMFLGAPSHLSSGSAKQSQRPHNFPVAARTSSARASQQIRPAPNGISAHPRAAPIFNHRNSVAAVAATDFKLKPMEGTPEPSSVFCSGACCSPGARDQTCAFSNVLFQPPSSFVYLEAGGGVGASRADTMTTYLHNRFKTNGVLTGQGGFSRWMPTKAPLSTAAGVTHVIESSIFLMSDLHSNFGHNMLDAVFPPFAAVHRIRIAAAAAATTSAAAQLVLSHVPDLTNNETSGGIFLVADPASGPAGIGWHRGKEERSWCQSVWGTVADLAQLRAACPKGCLIRSLVAGIGHTGLCMVDEGNAMAGARPDRALYAFRNRVYRRHSVPPQPPWVLTPGTRRQRVLFVKNKREVTNWAALMQVVGSGPQNPETKFVDWAQLSFKDKLINFREATVLMHRDVHQSFGRTSHGCTQSMWSRPLATLT